MFKTDGIMLNKDLTIYGPPLSSATAQEYGGYQIEEYEAGNDCAEGTVE